MAASAAFSVEGSTPTGAVAVAASSTVDLALLSTSGVNTVAWSIVGNHSSGASNPTITPAGSPSGATASFPMPAGAGQSYLVQCVVNGGVDLNGNVDAALTKRHIVGVNNAAGRVPLCVGENTERSATHGWTETINDIAAGAGSVFGDLVAALRATTGTAGEIRYLKGYTTEGDGGEGAFRWSDTAATDDAGTVLNVGGFGTSAAGWRRIYSGALDIRWFGAASGGAAGANTTAIQRAFDAAVVAAGPTSVFIPRGTFATNAALSAVSTETNPLEVYGVGYDSHIVATITGNNAMALAASGATFSRFTLRDLRISGQFARGVNLTATSGSNVRVERVKLSGATFDNGDAGTTIAAIAVGGLDDVWIVGCDLSGNGKDQGGGIGKGYEILKNSGAIQSRIRVVGNKIVGSDSYMGICLFDVADSIVADNYVDQGNTPGASGPPVTLGYGITIYDVVGASTTRRNLVRGNHVKNAAGMGIYLEQSYDSAISANVLQDTCKQITEPSLPLAGIVANGAAAAISGNAIKTTSTANGTHGVAFTSAGTSVTGNRIEGVSAAVKIQGDAHGSTISGNTGVGNVHGVLVDNSVDPERVTIVGNFLEATSGGVNVQTGSTLSGSTVQGNTCTGAQFGLLFQTGCIDNQISGNTFEGGSDYAISIPSGATNNRISGNTVRNQDDGISVAAANCAVTENDVSDVTTNPLTLSGAKLLTRNNRVASDVVSDQDVDGVPVTAYTSGTAANGTQFTALTHALPADTAAHVTAVVNLKKAGTGVETLIYSAAVESTSSTAALQGPATGVAQRSFHQPATQAWGTAAGDGIDVTGGSVIVKLTLAADVIWGVKLQATRLDA